MGGIFKYASWVKIFYLFIVLISFIGCRKLKYPTGRDTVKAFGNGRFQIGRTDGYPNFLDDEKEDEMILSRVVDYEEEGDKVFVTGFYPPARKVVYVLLDLRREKYYIYKNSKDIPKMYKKDFKSLKIE